MWNISSLGRRDAEEVAVAVRRVREHVVEGQARVRLVLRPRVRDVERVRRRRHVREVELGHLRDCLEDRRQLLCEAPDLVLRQLEPREPRDVQHLVPRDPRHLPILPNTSIPAPRSNDEGPLSEPFEHGSERTYAAWTFAACRPLSPCTTSNETR